MAPKTARAIAPKAPVAKKPVAEQPVVPLEHLDFKRVADNLALDVDDSDTWNWTWESTLALVGNRLLVGTGWGANRSKVTLVDTTQAAGAAVSRVPGFAKLFGAGGKWPHVWIADYHKLRFHQARGWVPVRYRRPPDPSRMVNAKALDHGRILGLFLVQDYRADTPAYGLFRMLHGSRRHAPRLVEPKCVHVLGYQDPCHALVPIAFDALPDGHVYVLATRESSMEFHVFGPGGGTGTTVAIPPDQSFTDDDVPLYGSVSAVSASEVYFGAGAKLPIVYRYDGSKIESLGWPRDMAGVVDQPVAGARFPVFQLFALAGGDLYAVFGRPGQSYPEMRLYHRSGGTWKRIELPSQGGKRARPLRVVARSPSDLWVLVSYDDKGVVYHATAPRAPRASGTSRTRR